VNEEDEQRARFEALGVEEVRGILAAHRFNAQNIRWAVKWLAEKEREEARRDEASQAEANSIASEAKDAAVRAAVAAESAASTSERAAGAIERQARAAEAANTRATIALLIAGVSILAAGAEWFFPRETTQVKPPAQLSESPKANQTPAAPPH
jgi:CHASE3 domain sensor protein